MKTPSYEYELLHQFEVVFRDGEHKTQAVTRDYSKVWENVIDNPPAEGVTPVHVYRMNGMTCAVIAGMDELVENEECAMEIARLSARLAEDAKRLALANELHSKDLRKHNLRAQIAVLEQLSERWSIRSCACGLEVLRRISDLRKELKQ